MTDREVLDILQSDTPLGRGVREFSNQCGAMEQAGMQRRPPTPIEARRMQIEAVKKIASAIGANI